MNRQRIVDVNGLPFWADEPDTDGETILTEPVVTAYYTASGWVLAPSTLPPPARESSQEVAADISQRFANDVYIWSRPATAVNSYSFDALIFPPNIFPESWLPTHPSKEQREARTAYIRWALDRYAEAKNMHGHKDRPPDTP